MSCCFNFFLLGCYAHSSVFFTFFVSPTYSSPYEHLPLYIRQKECRFLHLTLNSCINFISWDQHYLNISKECLTLFHQKLLFDLSKYMAVDIIKILCKIISCGPKTLHNDIYCSLYPAQETIYLLQGPTYASDSILLRKVFSQKTIDIIWNSYAMLTTKIVSQNLMAKEYVISWNTKDKSNRY